MKHNEQEYSQNVPLAMSIGALALAAIALLSGDVGGAKFCALAAGVFAIFCGKRAVLDAAHNDNSERE